MASDGPSPHPSSLRLGLPAPQPSRCHHAQSLLGPSFHDPRTHHVLESHLERAAPLSRRDDERCHAIGSHSSLHCASILQPTTPPQVVAFQSFLSPRHSVCQELCVMNEQRGTNCGGIWEPQRTKFNVSYCSTLKHVYTKKQKR